MDGIRQYLLRITVAAVVCAVTNNLAGRSGSTAGVIKLLTGLFLAICVISPLLRAGSLNLSSFYTDMTLEADEAVADGKAMAYESVRGIIKQRIESYILDKAASMDLSVDVEVILDSSDPPQPNSVDIKTDISPYAKEVLSRYIEDTLGISKENQFWH